MTVTKSGETTLSPEEIRRAVLRCTQFEAVQWTGANRAIENYTGLYNGKKIFISNITDNQERAQLYDVRKGRWEEVHIGDWIVKDSDGYFYRYHPNSFDKKFELTDGF